MTLLSQFDSNLVLNQYDLHTDSKGKRSYVVLYWAYFNEERKIRAILQKYWRGAVFVLILLLTDEDFKMLVFLGLFELPCGGDVTGGKMQ